MQEEWRPIPGYEDRYLLSNTGLVMSLLSQKLLCQSLTYDGYHEVGLSKDGISHTFKVHRLVVQVFLPEQWDPSLEVNHKDGNKDNNCIDNLEMVTHQQNMDHYWRSDVFEEHRAEYFEYSKNKMKALWSTPEFRNKVQAVFDSPEYKKAHSEAGKKVYADPVMREQASNHSKKMWSDPEFHDKQIEAIKRGWNNPEKRKAASKRLQGLVWMTDPDGKNVRVLLSDVEEYISKGYKKGRAPFKSNRSVPIYCAETDTTYMSMSECDRMLGWKDGDTYLLLNGSKIKRIQSLRDKYHLSFATDKVSNGSTSW